MMLSLLMLNYLRVGVLKDRQNKRMGGDIRKTINTLFVKEDGLVAKSLAWHPRDLGSLTTVS